MNSYIKGAFELFLKRLPLKNTIIFESIPDYSDNARAVFDELVKRGVNEEYSLVWAAHSDGVLPDDLKDLKNVVSVNMNSFKYKYYYSYTAKAFAVSNYFMQRRREEQYYIYLAHGAAFKAIKDKRYSVPDDCKGCDFCSYSDYISRYDVTNLNTYIKDVNVLETGFARNDVLFKENKKCKKLFETEKYIYWLPTFRQKKDDKTSVSSISVPFIYNTKWAEKINETAKQCGITLVLKPHPAQDLSKIRLDSLSNIKLIDNGFLDKNGIKNYELLAGASALLSDYSSVFYDYLLCDKPIGFCWEDYDEYLYKEGIIPDLMSVTDCGEKLYTADELCEFIKNVANGNDVCADKRNEIKDRIHKYTDGNSSKRIADIILQKVKGTQ